MNFPGFIPEAINLIELYELPNIIDETSMSQQKWKSTVKSNIKATYEKELKLRMTTSKLKDGPLLKEKFEKKEYLVSMQGQTFA